VSSGLLWLSGRETLRVLKLWTQTIMAPVLSSFLFILVFGLSLGGRIKEIDGWGYDVYIVPGLITMAMVQAAYSNNSSSVFQARFDRYLHDVLAALRARLDLSSPILEQLACAHLLPQLEAIRAERKVQLRAQRRALVSALHRYLPEWTFEVPGGGQVLWCELPAPVSGALAAAAADRGVRVTPGSRFAADGTLESWLRLPYTRPGDELTVAVELLAQAWAALRSTTGSGRTATASGAGRSRTAMSSSRRPRPPARRSPRAPARC
jgi:hypothetical protein